MRDGRRVVEQARALRPVGDRAQSVILFVGDGMGVATVTAARIFEGQQRGERGEENSLSFETLPYLALVKTYNTDAQTPDSAGTMTAMMTGAKTRAGVIGVDQAVVRGQVEPVARNRLQTLLELAETRGLSTGVVTTTRLTHATPACCYAHAADRNWESDAALPAAARETGAADIARQLIEFPFGDGLEVALGGGRSMFRPFGAPDPEDGTVTGVRRDGRDLSAEWLRRDGAAYVWNKSQFDGIDAARTKHLLGLFDPSHMEYEHDRGADTAGEPSLTQMTVKAIEILSRNPKGFFLMVEAGRIDHAHHAANAYRALNETVELSNAVRVALQRTKADETLIIVTADHSHTMTISGYAPRGHPILGKASTADGSPATDATGRPYATLAYANGPGYSGASASQPEGPKVFPHFPVGFKPAEKGRPDLSDVDTCDPNHLQECGVPLQSETHGGEDVPLYAGGPAAHLFHGVIEQNVIYHVMAFALRLDAEPADASAARIETAEDR
ncbi:MAG: alkaline phosphatase [Phycisphaerales bacterium]|nr:MAG: alkaline phosphatase [Phycisphaerales bacterium]